MFGFRMLRVLAPLAVVCGALFAVSCGSSNTTPSSSPTSYPTSGAVTSTLGTTGGPIVLPQVSPGAYVTLNYSGSSASPLPSPFPASGVTMNITVTSGKPANAPAPTSVRRSRLSQANAVAVQYITFTLSSALPTNFLGSEILTLSSTMPVNQPYYIEVDDISNTSNPYINTFPGTAVNNGTVTFSNTNGFNTLYNGFATAATAAGTQSLNTTDTYLMQIYYLQTGTSATPTPSPAPVSSGTLPPVATPTPVVVATTVPLGSGTTVQLPVVVGGYIANNIVVPANAGSGSLTVSGSPALPTGITAIGGNQSFYPFYVLGFSATSAASFASPAFNLVLPLNFNTSAYPIEGALCTTGACPVDTNDENISAMLTTTNGVSTVSFAAGAFPGFSGVSTTPQYIIVYSSRSVPAQNNAAPVAIGAGATGTVTLPAISGYGGSLNIGGLAGATTVNVTTEPGLLPNINIIGIPNTQTIFYSLSINATPHVATAAASVAGSPLCGSSGCTLASVTVPPALVTTAGSARFYVEECSASACPVSSSDVLQLTTPTTALTVPGTFGTDIPSLDPTNPSFLVFFYQ